MGGKTGLRRSSGSLNHSNKTSKSWSITLFRYVLLALAFGYSLYVLAFYGKSTRVPSEMAVSGSQNKDKAVESGQNQFRIRHVFHHNTGIKHLTHKRLDITQELLRSDGFVSYEAAHQTEYREVRETQIGEREPRLGLAGDQVLLADNYGDTSYRRVDLDDDYTDLNDEPVLSQWFANQSPWTKAFELKTDSMPIVRLQERAPDFVESYLAYALEVGSEAIAGIHMDWVKEDEVPIPDVVDKQTVVSLALMASNAYVKIPGEGDWQDVGQQWNDTEGFGWMDDGIRGHVFANSDNSTIVVAIKGTSATGLTGGTDSETSNTDKVNDNLLFSCCCARVSYMWQTVCDCYESSYTCNQRCLEKEMKREDRYYRAAMDIYRNVSSLYPDSNIWLTGHSLGGALSSLVGRTYGLPTVTFQAPGELLATRRLHLPMPPGIPSRLEHIWHFGHTADPIFMGVCNGASSTCAVAGYAMETQCHSGKVCVYDVVSDLGWHVSITNHRIHTVIDDVLLAYNNTAECVVPPPCHDCYNWDFVVGEDDKKSKKTTTKRLSTSTSTSPSATPTEPGNCLKRTWYGRCIKYEDEKPVSSVSATSSAHQTSAASTRFHTNSTLITSTVTRSSSVESRPPASSSGAPEGPKKCAEYSWLGYCKRYEGDDRLAGKGMEGS